MIERLRRAVRLEDVLLAAWLVLVEPLLAPADSSTGSSPSPLEGFIGLAALVGLANLRLGTGATWAGAVRG